MPIKTCKYCSREFKASNNDIKFCCRECGYKGRQKPSRTTFIEYVCEFCGKPFMGWRSRPNRFCSSICRSKFAARQPKPSKRRPENFIDRSCEFCGKEFKIHKCHLSRNDGNRHGIFCSRGCRDKSNANRMVKQGNHNYRGGKNKRGEHWLSIARGIRKRDNYTCKNCGKYCGKRYEKGRKLQVHHIVPVGKFDGDFDSANNSHNLVSLCQTCHIKIEHGLVPCPTVNQGVFQE